MQRKRTPRTCNIALIQSHIWSIPRLASVAVVATGLVGLSSQVSAGATFNFTKLIDTEDLVPNGSGETFSSFGNVIAIDGQNAVVRGIEAETGDRGVYAFIQGTGLIKVADFSDVIPGSSVNYDAFDDHVEFRDGKVVFFGSADGDVDGTDALVVADIEDLGSPILIARENVTPVPGQPGEMITALSNSEDYGFDGTRVFFEADTSGIDGTFFSIGGTLDTVFLEDGIAPSSGTFEFASSDPMPDFNGPNTVMRTTDSVADEAIQLFDGDTISTIVDQSDLIPDGSGDTFTGFFKEVDIDAGIVAFVGEGPGGKEGLYITDGVTIERVIDNTMTLPDGAQFNGAGHFAYSGGNVMFKNSNSNGSLFVWREGVISTVLQVGDTLDGRTVTSIGTFERPALDGNFAGLDLNFDDGVDAVYLVEMIIDTSCPADIVAPFDVVDVFDLLDLLANWGTNGAGANIADPPNDVVDIFDLLALLAAWGSCP